MHDPTWPSAAILPSFRHAHDDDQTNERNDFFNYALLIILYTLQGIPLGLSASIPFLIQQKIRSITSAADQTRHIAVAMASTAAEAASTTALSAAKTTSLAYNANAIFALCSWPFSLKLLWAPIVDAVFFRVVGRRKSWLVPVQALAGLLMVGGASFVEKQLGLGAGHVLGDSINVQGVTAFFFVLYFLMATQDIAVDGWALTMLSPKNRGRGPVCNSIGQNIGYFLSFVGFLALNDADSCEMLWRPLFRLPSNPEQGLVSLGSFIRSMGYLILFTTMAVAFFKQEEPPPTRVAYSPVDNNMPLSADALLPLASEQGSGTDSSRDVQGENLELDASEIGLRETYHRLWAVCQLPAVRWLFLILLTYRFPTALADQVKLLKAVEYGLPKSVTALLSPTVILPLGILVPIFASRFWQGHPLQQFMTAYKLRVTLVPLVDIFMLFILKRGPAKGFLGVTTMWSAVVISTALQSIVSSLQFNAQMTFFAHRVDPAIGGSYMTLLNTAANLGGTWPASLVMWLVGKMTRDSVCTTNDETGLQHCTPGRDPYFLLQAIMSLCGCIWIFVLGKKVQEVGDLPDGAWRTRLLETAVVQGRTREDNIEDGLMKQPLVWSPGPEYDVNGSPDTRQVTGWSSKESKSE